MPLCFEQVIAPFSPCITLIGKITAPFVAQVIATVLCCLALADFLSFHQTFNQRPHDQFHRQSHFAAGNNQRLDM